MTKPGNDNMGKISHCHGCGQDEQITIVIHNLYNKSEMDFGTDACFEMYQQRRAII